MPTPHKMTFELALEDFDLDVLPAHARDLSTDAFRRAVTSYYEHEFADLDGQVTVDFGTDRLIVSWKPTGATRDLFDDALELLRLGKLQDAVRRLRALVAVEPTNPDAHYNLGMALSDLGELDMAQLHLLKVIHLDPEHVNALVALGVALYRSGDPSASRRRLEQALALDPENGYAHRNLAAILASSNDHGRAIEHLRAAHRLLPDDQASSYGLAQALEESGNDSDRAEADRLYGATIALNPGSEIGQRARKARSHIAQTVLHAASPGLRMDAVMYCLGALERFEGMSRDEIQAIGFEIAMLGRRGLDVNDPNSRYTLRSLPGEFSGLHLVSIMFTAFKQIAPETDVGFDLSREYAAAISLHHPQNQSR